MRLKYVGSVWKIFKRDVKKKLVGSFDTSGVKILHCWILFVSVGNWTTSALELHWDGSPGWRSCVISQQYCSHVRGPQSKNPPPCRFSHSPVTHRRQTDGMCHRKRSRCKQTELGETKASQALRGEVIDENSAPRTGMFDIYCASALFLCN